jgi:hypothetical protein
MVCARHWRGGGVLELLIRFNGREDRARIVLGDAFADAGDNAHTWTKGIQP